MPNGTGGMVRPLAAKGRFREIHGRNSYDPPERAAELHARMQGNQPWTPEQVKALNGYSGDDYRNINDGLRGRKSLTPQARTQAEVIDSAMRPIPDSIVTYRTTHRNAFGFSDDDNGPLTDAQLDALIGRTFHDPAPVSTSVNQRKNTYFQLKIKVPAGARGAYIADISDTKTEYEMLLAQGTHFRIERYERTGGFDRPDDVTLHLTVVGQDEQPV